MGAGKWNDEYAEALQGARRVIVVADKDSNGTGRQHALQVVESLRRVGAAPELVEAASGKDAADHLAAGHALADFVPVEFEPEPDFERETRDLVGLMHCEVLDAEIPARNELVEDIVDAGTVGVIAGLPFAGKSWVAQEIAHKVAAGSGLVFGRFPVLIGGPVIYVWQDDSERNERLRIHTYAERHDEYRRDMRIRWLLNEGVRLPDDIEALRELIERDSAVVLVGDSLYNLLGPEVELKAEAVATVFAAVKHGICDPTGCTVLVVDHSPWPTDSNKGQRRSYGSVFKAAAIRWGIHLEADDKDDARLHVEAKGNNIAGLRRSPAIFDPDTLEIRLVDVERVSEEEVDERVLEYLAAAGWTATKTVCESVTGRDKSIRDSLKRLEQAGRVDKRLGPRPGPTRHRHLLEHKERCGIAGRPEQWADPGRPCRGVCHERGRSAGLAAPRKGGRPTSGRPRNRRRGRARAPSGPRARSTTRRAPPTRTTMAKPQPSSTPGPRGGERAKDAVYISAADAWLACGADQRFEPSRPDLPASGRMLWRLNVCGKLTLDAASRVDDSNDRP